MLTIIDLIDYIDNEIKAITETVQVKTISEFNRGSLLELKNIRNFISNNTALDFESSNNFSKPKC